MNTNSDAVKLMEKAIYKSYNNIGGLIVMKNGEKVYENYYNSCDDKSNIMIFSTTKSITSMLLGIAMKQGYIDSVEQKVLEFYPDYQIPENEKMIQNIKLKDIITMTAPYKYSNFMAPYIKYFKSEDWVHTSLDYLGGKKAPGKFMYAGMIGPDILSGIISQKTGMAMNEYAYKNLFEPLEISEKPSIIFKTKEEQMAYYKSMNTNGWVADTKGHSTAGWGLSLTTTEMAKLGQLYLEKGMWNGEQVVPRDWVEASTTRKSYCNKYRLAYGYLWWILDEKEHAYAAMGDGGNVIYVNESKGLVIAIASLFVPRAKIRIKLIRDYIEPAFEDYKER